MLINSSYFIGERDIPNTQDAAIAAALDTFIRKYEKEYLTKSLGYELFKAFTLGLQADPVEQKYTDLLFGKEFNSGKKKWDGFVSITDESPTISVDLLNSDIFFTVGKTGAPAAGDDTYVNEDLAGKSYRVTQRAYGPLEALKEDESNEETADIIINDDGGFSFLNNVKFSEADKFVITLLSSPLDVSSVDLAAVPDSPIADYTYYHWLRFNVTQTSGVGENLPTQKNADNASPIDKMVAAWNDMVNKNRMLNEFLKENASDYPEYVAPVCYEDYGELFHFKNSLL
jgi:hypothetical protein